MLNLKVDSLFQYVNSEEVEHEGEKYVSKILI